MNVYVYVCVCSVSQLCPTLCNPMDCSPPGSSVYGDSPGKNTRVGCHALLQGIFPTQGSNPGLPHCGQMLYPLSHQGSIKNLLANAGDLRDSGSIPGLGRSPREGHGNSLQYSCLENPHGQKSLLGYSAYGRKESDTTEQLNTHMSKVLEKILFKKKKGSS